MTMNEFVAKNNVTMDTIRWHENPSLIDKKWGASSDHWRCTIRRGRKSLTIYFSMGYGHKGRRPEVAEVLGCLVMDAGFREDEPEDIAANLCITERQAGSLLKYSNKIHAGLLRLFPDGDIFEVEDM